MRSAVLGCLVEHSQLLPDFGGRVLELGFDVVLVEDEVQQQTAQLALSHDVELPDVHKTQVYHFFLGVVSQQPLFQHADVLLFQRPFQLQRLRD